MEPADSDSHVWHIFTITTDHRDDLAQYHAPTDIQTAIHYPCAIDQQAVYYNDSLNVRMPVAERLQHQIPSLPIGQVMDDADVDYVITALINWPGAATPGDKCVRLNRTDDQIDKRRASGDRSRRPLQLHAEEA